MVLLNPSFFFNKNETDVTENQNQFSWPLHDYYRDFQFTVITRDHVQIAVRALAVDCRPGVLTAKPRCFLPVPNTFLQNEHDNWNKNNFHKNIIDIRLLYKNLGNERWWKSVTVCLELILSNLTPSRITFMWLNSCTWVILNDNIISELKHFTKGKCQQQV